MDKRANEINGFSFEAAFFLPHTVYKALEKGMGIRDVYVQFQKDST